MYSLKGRRVVVTGAGQGIGRGIASLLASNGASVALLDMNKKILDETVASMDSSEGRVFGITADVTDYRQLCDAGEKIREEFKGPVDTVVINAGISERCRVEDLTEDRWLKVLNVNLNGTFFTYKAFEKDLLSVDSPRRSLVIISSGSAFSGTGGGAHYAASKAGQLGLMRALAQELGPKGITVNAIAPRTINVGILNTLYPTADAMKELIDKIPVRRLGTDRDVAETVLFLISDSAGFIHGQTILVDGGRGLG